MVSVSAWEQKREGWLGNSKSKQRSFSEPKETREEEAEDYAVFYVPVRCPRKACRSKNVKCYSSTPPVRYHVCRVCKTRFKSIEH
ncbi:MAG: hypothetical protein COV74_03475 [Candidatus Omnitrophica bacterium CG11_big_fil_rev_8_21_14_0_20_45_26]|uniref:Uncharacterized protein n=1 Tax=Candidatus Abzuiibacterium crystallinum TaxID=1974748 RepID=A0A2H0LQW9_9BACT|nr:MAG: hypothetical protein COV74_03475 [Candidatus Omnitrophica bacterium CG11_big_fil_rev_8_21_14_0_20_45_26]PIW63325.1 MAG: hypothetical protein COW12_10815 [Candidatus Omnitrophica bacterium CG12_big_fil_rev_8_21_14_0_65_45_16]